MGLDQVTRDILFRSGSRYEESRGHGHPKFWICMYLRDHKKIQLSTQFSCKLKHFTKFIRSMDPKISELLQPCLDH